MKAKYNFGLLKNLKLRFIYKDLNSNKKLFYEEMLSNAKVVSDNIIFNFVNGFKLEISTKEFNKMSLSLVDDVLVFENKNNSINMSALLAFTMFDTFGFPIELTQEILAEQGLTIDIDGFHILRNIQKLKTKDTFKSKTAF